jgi:hypothetical protein
MLLLLLLASLASLPAVSAQETRLYTYCDHLASGPRECGASAHSHDRNCTPVAGGPLGICDDPAPDSTGAGVLVQGVDPCPAPEGGDYCWGANVRVERETEPAGCYGNRYTVTVEWWLGADPRQSYCADERIQ